MPTKTQRNTSWLCAAWLIACAAAAQAQTTVYRCGPDGRSYSEQPCAGGRALTIDDRRSDEQREAGTRAVQREAEAGQQLAHDNLERARAQRPADAISLSGDKKKAAQAAKGDSTDKPYKPKLSRAKRPEGFIAVEPGSKPKTKRKRSA